MSVEQRELLMAVNDIAGIVDVERDGCRLARVAIHPCVEEPVAEPARYFQLNSHSLLPSVADVGTIPAGEFRVSGCRRKSRFFQLQVNYVSQNFIQASHINSGRILVIFPAVYGYDDIARTYQFQELRFVEV